MRKSKNMISNSRTVQLMKDWQTVHNAGVIADVVDELLADAIGDQPDLLSRYEMKLKIITSFRRRLQLGTLLHIHLWDV